MNTDVEILDKTPANWIQQSIKRIIYHNQAGFTQRMQCKAVLIWANLFREHINGSNKRNCMIILSRIRKITYEGSTWIPKGDILWNTRNGWYQWTLMGFFSGRALHIWSSSLCLRNYPLSEFWWEAELFPVQKWRKQLPTALGISPTLAATVRHLA